jgi:hypothetical protein
VDPTTCERDYDAAELEFMQAIQQYKQSSGRMFPTLSEVLEALVSLGYEKVTDDCSVRSPLPTAANIRTGPHLKPDQLGGGHRHYRAEGEKAPD